ncbi:dockerin type I repeat-containing protein [Lacrimispora xylanisolvens]|uniref:dockerin type I repeat-containing protein n=1 Tax=Lacrimispora xylanisolvens TaxID=384636 RepID=UPI003D9CBB72
MNSLDVLKLQRYLLGLEHLSDAGKAAADLNGDGKVNSQDLLLLQKKVLGM